MQANQTDDRTSVSPTSVTVEELVALKRAVSLLRNRSGKRVRVVRSGSSASAALGRGLDFSEVREYQPTDDVRMIDWKVRSRWRVGV